MILPVNATISPEKLIQFLLAPRKRNDKSKYLAEAGYSIENWRVLENDLRRQILSLEAVLSERSQYGQTYEISGRLTGPTGKTLDVNTVWMIENASGVTKFITLYPNKGKER
jgi:hypothetical protein